MKVLLIQPPSCDPMTDEIYLFEPLALEYLGAGLKQDGHEVRLLDARITLPLQQFYREFGRLYTNAVPLHRALPTLFRFGAHGMLLRIRMLGRFLEKLKSMHLDY